MTMRGLHGQDANDGTDTGTDSGADAPRRHAGVRSDGSCLAEFAFTPQTADSDGDFVQSILSRDQYEIIET